MLTQYNTIFPNMNNLNIIGIYCIEIITTHWAGLSPPIASSYYVAIISNKIIFQCNIYQSYYYQNNHPYGYKNLDNNNMIKTYLSKKHVDKYFNIITS